VYRQRLFACLALLSGAACAGPPPEPPADTAAMAAARADSMARVIAVQATELRDTAKATLATLLDNPATATWDSVVVVQPPERDGRMPSLAVCGRMGSGGAMSRFVYLGKFTVFVEDAKNREQFAELWGKNCAGEVVLAG